MIKICTSKSSLLFNTIKQLSSPLCSFTNLYQLNKQSNNQLIHIQKYYILQNSKRLQTFSVPQ